MPGRSIPRHRLTRGSTIDIDTEAGAKRLELLDETGDRLTFRAAMGQPEQLTRAQIEVGGVAVDAVTLRVGNPQCVVLGDVTEARLHSLAAALAVHPHFPEGDKRRARAGRGAEYVHILIWERGVGPTEASGSRRVRGSGGRHRVRRRGP